MSAQFIETEGAVRPCILWGQATGDHLRIVSALAMFGSKRWIEKGGGFYPECNSDLKG